MPTVSVKRDLLFQALGRTYSECRLHSLSTVAILRGWDCTPTPTSEKGIVAAIMQPGMFWPWAVGRGGC